MSFIHNIIKIKYVKEGFLPDYPYHMISDKEMFDAFIFNDVNFFDIFYILPSDKLKPERDKLKEYIQKSIENDEVPNWIYSYMLGEVISPNSDQQEISDLINLMYVDNKQTEFNEDTAEQCLKISKAWLYGSNNSESQQSKRPATIYGEPIVIKSLRLTSLQAEV